jgi:hypothetical protein
MPEPPGPRPPVMSSPPGAATPGSGAARVSGHGSYRSAWVRPEGATATYCPVSVIHTHDEGSRRDARCTWCGHRIEVRPVAWARAAGPSALGVAYRRTYDPDWGGGRRDVDP